MRNEHLEEQFLSNDLEVPESAFFGSQSISPNNSQSPSPRSSKHTSPVVSPFVRFEDDIDRDRLHLSDSPAHKSLPTKLSRSNANDEAIKRTIEQSAQAEADESPFRVTLHSIDSPDRPPELLDVFQTPPPPTTIVTLNKHESHHTDFTDATDDTFLNADTLRKPILLRRYTSRVLKEEVSLFELISFQSRLIYIIWWCITCACFMTVATSQIGSFRFDSESESVKSTASNITTWSIAKMFWNGNGQFLAVLYFQGVYITPYVQLLISLIVMFSPMYAARRRFILVRQRFFAKLSIMPTFMLLIDIEAFDNKVITLFPAQMYIQPTRVYFVQMIAGPVLVLLHNYVINLNRLGPLPRTSILVSRISLFCSGCSLVCAIGFLSSNMLDIEITGLLGRLLADGEQVKHMFLPKLLIELPSHYGIDTLTQVVITSYFTLIMAILPALAIFAECVWRIGAGVYADELTLAIENGINPKEFGDLFGPLHVFRKFVQMFYTYDIFCLALFFAWLEIENVAEYIQGTLFPHVCEEYEQFKCFGMKTSMPMSFGWLFGHVLTYYISSGFPMIFRMKILAKYVWTSKLLTCQWNVGEAANELDREYIQGMSAYESDDEAIFDRWARLGENSLPSEDKVKSFSEGAIWQSWNAAGGLSPARQLYNSLSLRREALHISKNLKT